MKEYKAVLAESSSVTQTCSDTGHLYEENRLIPRLVWFKGSRDQDLRGDIAA
tara:strand:+ start:934 stop:1089 length:156 start_codon:yes stop_codon:yes gene_type:complete